MKPNASLRPKHRASRRSCAGLAKFAPNASADLRKVGPRLGRATDRSAVRTRALRLCRALRITASYPRCAVRPHPRARGSSLAGAGAAAHDEPARRACNLAVMMKGATDELRPSLSPVLRSFNRRIEGRYEETDRYRHQVREGSVRAQLHLAQDRQYRRQQPLWTTSSWSARIRHMCRAGCLFLDPAVVIRCSDA
jgi:hypothetical protein